MDREIARPPPRRTPRYQKVMLLCSLAFLAVVLVWSWHVLRANLTSSWYGEPVARIAYEEGQNGEILLPAHVDGVDVGPCFLDSGAQARLMLVTPAAARRANLATYVLLPWSIIRGSMGGSSGLVPTRTAREFRVGPIGLRRPAIAELAELQDRHTRRSGAPMGGICSAAIFHAAVVDIDWRSHQTSFYKPGDVPAELQGLDWIPLTMIRSRPYMKIRFDGGHDGLFLIDTGMSSTIHFHHHVVQEFDLLASRVSGAAQARGIGGWGTVRMGQLAHLQFGEHQAGPVTASFAIAHRYLGDRGSSGRIGRGLLRNYRTIIDVPNKRAAFVAYDQQVATALPR